LKDFILADVAQNYDAFLTLKGDFRGGTTAHSKSLQWFIFSDPGLREINAYRSHKYASQPAKNNFLSFTIAAIRRLVGHLPSQYSGAIV
jgi:hypothetical protein